MLESPLLNRTYLINLLRENHLRLSKRRGQHFLTDGNILDKICRTADLQPDDLVLEIGAGAGTLTRELARRAGEVVAVESDRGLFRLLQAEISSRKNVHLIQADILRTDLDELRGAFHSPGKIKVVSNLPYSIAGPVLIKFLESDLEIDNLICMVQQEVGERLAAGPGSKRYGVLSLLTQMHSRPRIVFPVKRNCFFPPPRVDSVIVQLRMIPRPHPGVSFPLLWKQLVKTAFSSRRKMLKNNLARDPGLNYTPEEIKTAFSRVRLELTCRGEELTVEDFIRLTDALEQRRKFEVSKVR